MAVLKKTVTLNPGESKAVGFEFTPSEPRTYQVSVDGLAGSFTALAEAPLAGELGPAGGIGWIWHEPLTEWKYFGSGREIPLDEEIHLAPGWINRSDITIPGHIDLTVTYPDGTSQALAAVLNQDREARPRSGYHIQFEPFTSSQEGTYSFTAVLSSAGQVLDSATFELVTAAPVLATLYGFVTDAETGDPLAGVSVGLWSPDEAELLLHTTTNNSGYYLMENILPGNYVVYFEREGYETVKR